MIGTEILKLRTIRSPWLLLLAAQVVVVAGVAGPFLSEATDDPAVARAGAAHLGLAALFTLVLGIMALAGEHRHRTVTDTYLAHPRRGAVFTAKLITYSAVGAVFAIVGSVTVVATLAVVSAATGSTVDWSDPELWRTIGGSAGWNVAFAALGVGVGALVPNLTGAVTFSLVWVALVEGVLGRLIGSTASQWLPFAAGSALGRLPTGDLPQWTAALVLVAYVAAAATAAVYVTNRRDVA